MGSVGSNDENVSLITDATESPGQELARRRRRYAVMMGLRVVCVLGAVSTYRLSIVVALLFLVGGAVLPWCAVLIANDRLPRSHQPRRAAVHVDAARALPSTVATSTTSGKPTDSRPADKPVVPRVIEG